MTKPANAHANAGQMGDSVPPPPPALRQSATSPEAATNRKSLTATSKALVQEGLKTNLSAVEATSQLKVLCRKFAALTEKVKEETRIREEAEKEVRRLRVIVEGNNAPVVASCRAETQAYMKELKDAHDQLKEAHDTLKQELRVEKDKNDKLVSKALELEKEKGALMSAAAATSHTRAHESSSGHSSRARSTEWDREQASKIHETLTITIDELQDELSHKEDELTSYRERLQRERSRVKTLETELQNREETAQDERNMLKELETSIHEQRSQFEAIEKEMQLSEERLDEEATMRSTLEQQITTLNDVNAALEQRAKALVRRLELSQSMAHEMDELKLQLREADVDRETLVRSIKEVKDQHFIRETQWKAQMEQLRSEKLMLSSQISDLQNEITSLRAQNSLLSEWMLVRSENIAAAQHQQSSALHDDAESGPTQESTTHHKPHRPQRREADNYSSQSRVRVRPLEDGMYIHTSPSCPLSPSKTRSMTTASPIKQPVRGWSSRRASSVSSSASSSEDIDAWVNAEAATQRKGHEANRDKTAAALATRGRNHEGGSSRNASKLSDHERLRELMSRNRELQSRLQQETVATRNLEQEISDITSQRRQTAYD